MMKEKKQQPSHQPKILVYYIGVSSINECDINDYMQRVANKIHSSEFVGEMIFLPIEGNNSRIECVNPTYITRPKLINEHNKQMRRLNDEMLLCLEDEKKKATIKKWENLGLLDGLEGKNAQLPIQLNLFEDTSQGTKITEQTKNKNNDSK